MLGSDGGFEENGFCIVFFSEILWSDLAGPENLLLTPSFLHIPCLFGGPGILRPIEKAVGSSSKWFARSFWLGSRPLSTPSVQTDWRALASGEGGTRSPAESGFCLALVCSTGVFLSRLSPSHGDTVPTAVLTGSWL